MERRNLAFVLKKEHRTDFRNNIEVSLLKMN